MKLEDIIGDKIDWHRDQVIELNHDCVRHQDLVGNNYLAHVDGLAYVARKESEAKSHITAISTLSWVLQLIIGRKENGGSGK